MLRRLTSLACLAVVAVTLTLTPTASVASDDRDRHSDDDDDRHDDDDDESDLADIRAAVARGDVKPLSDILKILGPAIDGEVVGVEIEYEHGHWVYELRVADPRGRLIEYYVDAATARIDKTEVK